MLTPVTSTIANKGARWLTERWC